MLRGGSRGILPKQVPTKLHLHQWTSHCFRGLWCSLIPSSSDDHFIKKHQCSPKPSKKTWNKLLILLNKNSIFLRRRVGRLQSKGKEGRWHFFYRSRLRPDCRNPGRTRQHTPRLWAERRGLNMTHTPAGLAHGTRCTTHDSLGKRGRHKPVNCIYVLCFCHTHQLLHQLLNTQFSDFQELCYLSAYKVFPGATFFFNHLRSHSTTAQWTPW